MKCPKCFSENLDTQHFCGECGTRLIRSDEGAESHSETLLLPGLELTPGATFAGRYQIIEELGKGGMGTVYRALDKKLGEEIALKLIRPEAASDRVTLERFRTELKAARQIVHKNVARMFDLNEEKGIPYITMEYVKGENLRRLIKKVGRLSPEQAVPIARQVCQGLAEAHRLGVLHRDLKPQNIMIDEEGKARIMDFGLARFLKSDGTTETGVVIGTPAYISPERVEGQEADGRSDLYSLGIVLYEMVAGRTPFESESGLSLALKHVIETPKDPREINADIPEALSRIILKCLEKNKEIRYQSAEELIADLDQVENELKTREILRPMKKLGWKKARQWAKGLRLAQAFIIVAILIIAGTFISRQISKSGRLPWKRTIAVLPVEDRSPLKDQGNLCIGLQDNIITKLASIPGLRPLPMLSVASYNYDRKDAQRIGQELGADYLLRLTLQADEEKIRLKAELIDAKQNFVFQSYQVDRDKASFFALEDEIPRYISRALKKQLDEKKLDTSKLMEPIDVEAFFYYLEGMRLLEEVYPSSRREEDFNEGIRMYEKAIEIDPNYTLAYWGLGNAYEGLYHGTRKPEERERALEKMFRNYNEAHRLNPESAETNLGLGWAYFNKAENDRAFQCFKKALELDPDNPVVNVDAGAFLRSMGLYQKAAKFLSRAAKLDPLYVSPLIQNAYCQLCLGEFDKAISLIETAIEKDPENFSARLYYAILLVMTHRLDEAEKEIQRAQNIKPSHPDVTLNKGLLEAARGENEKALACIHKEERKGFVVTWIYILLGMKAEAIRNIEAGIEKGFETHGEYLYSYPSLAKNPVYRKLNDEPDFQEILKREEANYKEKLKKYRKL
ncbi:MAG: protein kinase [Clostridiales bacterium]|nr:protein kinase [Clostridiales bacterium]